MDEDDVSAWIVANLMGANLQRTQDLRYFEGEDRGERRVFMDVILVLGRALSYLLRLKYRQIVRGYEKG